jgi:hypothetical protein
MGRFPGLITLALGCCCWTVAGADDPDPRTVLNEARTLAREGKYEEALEKHLWFHENALKLRPSLYGVRLSFALSDWVRLGEKYPKAREALVAIRDKDTATITGGHGSFALFHDVAAINDYLDEEPRTVALFKTLDQKDHRLAERCYDLAEEDLANQREYKLCSQFIPDAIQRFDRIREMRERNLKIRKDDRLMAYAEKSFVERTCRLIEILVSAGRREDAEQVRDRALAVRDDRSLRDAIEQALRGKTGQGP